MRCSNTQLAMPMSGQRAPVRAARGLAELVLVAWLVVAGGGCARFDLREDIPWSKAYGQEPNKVVVTWTDTVLSQPGRSGVRGFGGRIMFFGEDEQEPLEVDGTLTVYAFRENAATGERPQPDRKFVFPAEQFRKHYSKSKLGPSYSVWLPWDPAGGPQEQVSLMLRFEPAEGATVTSDLTRQLLPGVRVEQMANTMGGMPSGTAAISPGASGHPATAGRDAALRPALAPHLHPVRGTMGPQPAAPAVQPAMALAGSGDAGARQAALIERARRPMQTTTLWVPPGAHQLGGAAQSRSAAVWTNGAQENQPTIPIQRPNTHPFAQGALTPAAATSPTGTGGAGDVDLISQGGPLAAGTAAAQASPASGAMPAGAPASQPSLAEIVAAVKQALRDEQALTPAAHSAVSQNRVLGQPIVRPRNGNMHLRPHPAGWPSSPPMTIPAASWPGVPAVGTDAGPR